LNPGEIISRKGAEERKEFIAPLYLFFAPLREISLNRITESFASLRTGYCNNW